MAEHHQPDHGESQPDVRYEYKDISYKGLIWSVVGLGVLAVAAHLGIFWMLSALYDGKVNDSENPIAASSQSPSPPDLPDGAPAVELYQLRVREDELLHGPVTRIPGHEDAVRIPVDRAMRLVLEEGLEGGRREQRDAAPSGSGDPSALPSRADQPEPASPAASGNESPQAPQENGTASEDSV